jgi:MFS family permease
MTGEFSAALGWHWTFITAGVALVIAMLLVVPIPPAQDHHLREEDTHILEFRPTLRARPAMAFITAYGAHCWEAFTLSSWGVAFLTFHLTTFEPDLNPLFTPIWVASVIGLTGLPASIIGNELCLHFGRRRVIFIVSPISAGVSAIFGFLLGLPYWFLIVMSATSAFLISLDSGSIHAGMVQRAPRGYAAATMAIHSMAGFGAGLIGPFVFGAVLDMAGDTTKLGWILAYASVGLAAFIVPIAIRFIGLKDDPGT